jgi:lipid-A-disaccharide synthase
MEYDIYKKFGAKVYFVGHPLPARIKQYKQNNSNTFGLPEAGKPVIGLLPGSRKQEIKALLNCFVKAAEIIHRKYPDCIFVIPVATPMLREGIEKEINSIKTGVPFYIVDGMALDIMEQAKVILTASGTATLEAAVVGTPFVAAYKVSFISWMFAKIMVKVKFMALPNILLNEKALPEFFQREATPEAISRAALKVLDDEGYRMKLKRKLDEAVFGLLAEHSEVKVTEIIEDILNKRGH